MSATFPGIKFESIRSRDRISALRSDIAGFFGRARRGPLDHPVRIESWREFEEHFGGLDPDFPMTFALRGYFANGGEIAWVHRAIYDANVDPERAVLAAQLALPQDPVGPAASSLFTGTPTGTDLNFPPFVSFVASSPGTWADDMTITLTPVIAGHWIRLRLTVNPKPEPAEDLEVVIPGTEVDPGDLVGLLSALDRTIHQSSRYIRSDFQSLEMEAFQKLILGLRRHNRRTLAKLRFHSCSSDLVEFNLKRVVTRLIEEPEIALIVYVDPEEAVARLMFGCLDRLYRQQDRMIVSGEVDLDVQDRASGRTVAAYAPWLVVPGLTPNETYRVSPAGHVAGVISRLDRDRGPHFSPANVALQDAIDLDEPLASSSSESARTDQVNRIRCLPGRGLMVWGARTLDTSSAGRHVAHQRFMHRLVRTIRGVAMPLIGETTGPELYRALTRAVTSLLLEAFRSGALRGNRPEEAFFVACGTQNNTHDDRVHGRVNCEVGFALAAPMEFITLRIRLSESGELEVFDS